MKRKRVGAVALLLALVLSLAGCGKSLKNNCRGRGIRREKTSQFLPCMMTGP